MRTLRAQIALYNSMHWNLAAAILAATASFYVLIHRPISSRLSQIDQQVSVRTSELNGKLEKARDLPALVAKVNQKRGSMEQFARKLPRQPDLGQFIREITQISQDSTLRKFEYRPLDPQRSVLFYELPFQMTLQGRFLSIAAFLRRVEDLPRLARVRDLSIQMRPGDDGEVEAEMTVSIYFAEGA